MSIMKKLVEMLLSEAIEVIAYYKINKLEGTDWALYPSIHFEAYFGNTNFTHKYQAAFFKTFGRKTEEHCGVARYNNRRIKAKLKGLPPAVHRKQALEAA